MHKRIHHDRALKLLATFSDEDLAYCALELRFAIEAVAYDKLRTYATRLPADLLETWQPPQAMKALAEFEPHAVSNFRLRIALEKEPGVPGDDWGDLGEHRTFELQWLRRAYNKLGSYLHLPSPKSSVKIETQGPGYIAKLRRDLQAIADTLAPIVASTIDGTMAEITQFPCQACGATIIRNVKGLEATRSARCLQDNCRAEHFGEFDAEGNLTVRLIATDFECQKCAHPTTIQNRHLDVGYSWTCEKCKTQHTIMERHWKYGGDLGNSEPPLDGA